MIRPITQPSHWSFKLGYHQTIHPTLGSGPCYCRRCHKCIIWDVSSWQAQLYLMFGWGWRHRGWKSRFLSLLKTRFAKNQAKFLKWGIYLGRIRASYREVHFVETNLHETRQDMPGEVSGLSRYKEQEAHQRQKACAGQGQTKSYITTTRDWGEHINISRDYCR